MERVQRIMAKMRERYPDKFLPEKKIFARIRRGAHLFIGTGCGEPQHLVNMLAEYVRSNPKAVFDAEVFHVWTLGVAPYADDKFQRNFRHNSFFIGETTRNAVNEGLADYTPIFLSQVPDLFRRGFIPIDVALVQTSPPDRNGYMSLGVSVDITKAAVEKAALVICQINASMPRVHGDTFIHIDDVDLAVHCDEPLLEYAPVISDELADQIGKYVAQLIEDGDTIQVGYGSIPNAILVNLEDKKHLGVHTELVSDGIVNLIKKGIVDNSMKTLDRGKTVATFCMGTRETYEFLDDNPSIDFRTIDYTNNPLNIAQQRNMAAINSALEIDLTGQASAESLGKVFYSGIGGQADFMRGAVLAPGGKTILALPSTAEGGEVSRILPMIREGAGVTLNRGDVHYVVTEYGIAYLHGKNVRERAMELIAIAHPDFRSWLIEEAKRNNMIYKDQAFIPGKAGEYPEELEIFRGTASGAEILLRPVKISDEPLLKDFFYSLSDKSLYRRFVSTRQDMPHDRLQELVIIDYSKEMVILAMLQDEDGVETLAGVGQYSVNEGTHTAEVAFVVKDEYQDMGIGTELLSYLTQLAKRQGLHGFTAEVLAENKPMMHVFEKAGFDIEKSITSNVYELIMSFRD
ncbi:MAG: GNAT family N-acetyltransferase [Actinobacteria bacterium]|jgi:acyl-CoA hydrolase/ribosomal protein S18 acetylase RimI-like enzyme|nr:MAG: GNAT family N-acetyltransferase [Actinomycetota bacterium]